MSPYGSEVVVKLVGSTFEESVVRMSPVQFLLAEVESEWLCQVELRSSKLCFVFAEESGRSSSRIMRHRSCEVRRVDRKGFAMALV